MIDALIVFGFPLVLGVPIVLYLCDERHLSGAMPPPPSERQTAIRAFVLSIARAERQLAVALLPAVNKVIEEMQAFSRAVAAAQERE